MGYLSAEKKQELFGKYGKSNTDTGSPESQIALFSFRINHLTEHLRSNKHDFGTQRALLRLVGKRRQLLEYLKEVDIEQSSRRSISVNSPGGRKMGLAKVSFGSPICNLEHTF